MVHASTRARRQLGTVSVAPPRALGVIIGAAFVAWSAVLAGLAARTAAAGQTEFKTFLAWAVAAVLSLLALLFANWTYSLWSLTYTIDRDALTIRWGLRRVIIPIESIQRMVPGRTLDEARVHGLNWWGCHVGNADVKRVGYTLFYSTHSTPDELLFIVTTEEAYALTVLEPGCFAEEIQARAALGPVEEHLQRSEAARPRRAPVLARPRGACSPPARAASPAPSCAATSSRNTPACHPWCS